MPIADDATATNALKRAALYAAQMRDIRLVRSQIDNPRHAERRELLVMRLDDVDARAADFYALMIEARGQQQHRIAT